MKTRFDNYGVWITAQGEVLNVSDMETTHILNCVRMMIQKPSRTMSMLIADIEKHQHSVSRISHLTDEGKTYLAQVTSMTSEKLKEFAISTPLFRSMCDELERRGVNVKNLLSMCDTCDAF